MFVNIRKDVDRKLDMDIEYPRSRTDQLSYVPTKKLVDTMFRTGQMVQASKVLYDFPDGKDDGRSIPLDRLRNVDLSDVAQEMYKREQYLAEHRKNIEKLEKEDAAAAKKEYEQYLADKKRMQDSQVDADLSTVTKDVNKTS